MKSITVHWKYLFQNERIQLLELLAFSRDDDDGGSFHNYCSVIFQTFFVTPRDAFSVSVDYCHYVSKMH